MKETLNTYSKENKAKDLNIRPEYSGFALLKHTLKNASLNLNEDIYEKLKQFNDLLYDANQRTDLTNVPQEESPIRHYADSLLILKSKELFKPGFSVIDVGTGAGFPGMPLAIARQDINFLLLDALKKRCDFLEFAVKELGLKNVRVLHSRVEDAAHGELREKFDLSLSRAVASMNVLLEYMLPFVRVDGAALCWKGPSLYQELETAKKAVEILGGSFYKTIELPIENRTHLVQVVNKTKNTPDKYPRRAGIPNKRPL
ncbi:MAG: 16S rRNA (guanine(527)-N(7))-methyltransferase RsmG [Eubacteriales bacterium]|nr:16S rRNA (guanine(527)-N(7))-methyltransferase RsmG [Eubacteriales bacterium]